MAQRLTPDQQHVKRFTALAYAVGMTLFIIYLSMDGLILTEFDNWMVMLPVVGAAAVLYIWALVTERRYISEQEEDEDLEALLEEAPPTAQRREEKGTYLVAGVGIAAALALYLYRVPPPAFEFFTVLKAVALGLSPVLIYGRVRQIFFAGIKDPLLRH